MDFFLNGDYFWLILKTDAKKFKDLIVECQDKIGIPTDEQESDKLAKELEGLEVKESKEDDAKENCSENKENETKSKDSEQNESNTSETDASDENKNTSSTEDTPEK